MYSQTCPQRSNKITGKIDHQEQVAVKGDRNLRIFFHRMVTYVDVTFFYSYFSVETNRLIPKSYLYAYRIVAIFDQYPIVLIRLYIGQSGINKSKHANHSAC